MTPTAPVRPTPVDYATPAAHRSARWGIAAVVRGALAWGLIAYMAIAVYAWMPRNMLVVVAVWPVALVLNAFGLWYAVRGLRGNERRGWIRLAMGLNLTAFVFTFLGTTEAVDTVWRAWKYDGRLIVSSNR